MKLFTFLFGNKKRLSSKQNLVSIDQDLMALKPAIKSKSIKFLSEDLMVIDSMGFLGSYMKSNSGKWIISWKDSDKSQHIGDHRKKGYGTYILYDVENDVITFEGNNLQRPMNGYVADDGTFCLEDWQFSNDLSGTFYIFSKQGTILLKKSLTANIYNSGISNSALLAVCQTANSQTDDGNRLYFFDIVNKSELFSIYPPSGWADSYEFDEDKRQLIVCFEGIGKFRYEADGNFVDSDLYQQSKLNSNNYVNVILTAKEILSESNLGEVEAKSALDAILRLRETLWESVDHSWKGEALKVQGLAHELLGDYNKAVELFEEALTINPKIGVKRKIMLLKKKLKL